jgi:hypothetical protein
MIPCWWAESQRVGDGAHQLQHVGQGETGLEPVEERAAGHVLHYDVAESLVIAEVVDTDDVGVVQPGDGLGLSPEPLD